MGLINRCFTSWRGVLWGAGGCLAVCGLCEGTFERSLIRSAHTAKERKRYSYIHLALIKELWKRSKYLSSVTNKHHVSKETLSLKI